MVTASPRRSVAKEVRSANRYFVQLGGKSYVRDKRFKLTNDGEMFDLSEAPFKEIPISAESADPQAVAARQNLQAVLDAHPAAMPDPTTAQGTR